MHRLYDGAKPVRVSLAPFLLDPASLGERKRPAMAMAMASEQRAKGEEFEKKAEQKLAGGFFFGPNYYEAGNLFDKSANCFKLAKDWARAGSAYTKLASCNLKSDGKHEAAAAYVDAANCYKKISLQGTAKLLSQAVTLFLEMGKLSMAARYSKEIGDIYEQQEDLNKAMDYFEQAVDLFESEESTTSVNQCKQKVAQIAAELEQYSKAIETYEEIARHSSSNNFLKYTVKGILLNAGICRLCKGDVVAVMNALDHYQELDPSFSDTREYQLLAELASSLDEGDEVKFTNALQEYDSITRLDPWKTTLLVRVKNAIKAKEDEEDDLT